MKIEEFPVPQSPFMFKISRFKQDRIHIACWVTSSVKGIRCGEGEVLVCFVDGYTVAEACTAGKANTMSPRSHSGL